VIGSIPRIPPVNLYAALPVKPNRATRQPLCSAPDRWPFRKALVCLTIAISVDSRMAGCAIRAGPSIDSLAYKQPQKKIAGGH
jgi:hypothetical protein